MIKSVTVTNYLGDRIKLELAKPENTGFVVKSITGLGPGKANISTSDVITTDGGLYNSARLPVRNIVISLEFLDDRSIEETRQRSYRYFPIKRQVSLLFETDNRTVEISGYVESNDPTIFSKNEGTEISIICPDPYFYSAGEDGVVSTAFFGTDPLFEFKFSNESLTEPLIEFGSLSKTTEQTIRYDGDVEIGVVITVHASGEANNLTIIHKTPISTGSIRIDTEKLKKITGSSIKEGDEIIISTMKGSKTVTLTRGGTKTIILNCLDKNTYWFQLVHGNNVFTYNTYSKDEDGNLIPDGGVYNLDVAIESRVRYEGV